MPAPVRSTGNFFAGLPPLLTLGLGVVVGVALGVAIGVVAWTIAR